MINDKETKKDNRIQTSVLNFIYKRAKISCHSIGEHKKLEEAMRVIEQQLAKVFIYRNANSVACEYISRLINHVDDEDITKINAYMCNKDCPHIETSNCEFGGECEYVKKPEEEIKKIKEFILNETKKRMFDDINKMPEEKESLQKNDM